MSDTQTQTTTVSSPPRGVPDELLLKIYGYVERGYAYEFKKDMVTLLFLSKTIARDYAICHECGDVLHKSKETVPSELQEKAAMLVAVKNQSKNGCPYYIHAFSEENTQHNGCMYKCREVYRPCCGT